MKPRKHKQEGLPKTPADVVVEALAKAPPELWRPGGLRHRSLVIENLKVRVSIAVRERDTAAGIGPPLAAVMAALAEATGLWQPGGLLHRELPAGDVTVDLTVVVGRVPPVRLFVFRCRPPTFAGPAADAETWRTHVAALDAREDHRRAHGTAARLKAPLPAPFDPALRARLDAEAAAAAKAIGDQVFAAHRYQNKLIEIERARREKWRAAIAAPPEIAALEADVKALVQALEAAKLGVRMARKAKRSRIPVSEGAAAEIASLRAAYRAKADALKAAKKLRKENPEHKALAKAIDEEAVAAGKAARAQCGCYWGTYLLAEAAAKAAQSAKMDPRFRRWTGEGRIGVQIKGGLPVGDIFGGSDRRLQIDRVDERAFHGRRGERRLYAREHVRVRIRIGSDGAGGPIFAELPVRIDRPLPADGQVMMASVARRRVGVRHEWYLRLAVAAPSMEAPRRQGLTCGIDLGWRRRDESLRIGYLDGEDGWQWDIRLPDAIASAFDLVDSLQAIRDRNFNAARAALLTWLPTHEPAPEVKAALEHLVQWRAIGKLARAARIWSEHRVPGDEEAWKALDEWRRRDEHLLWWEANERENNAARRLDFFRKTALAIARRYAVVRIEEFDLRKMARLPGETDPAPAPLPARHGRVMAALSTFRQVLLSTCAREGTVVEQVSAVNTTRRCHVCGHVEAFDAANEVTAVCGSCKAVWDQDANAAVNIRRASGAVVAGAREAARAG